MENRRIIYEEFHKHAMNAWLCRNALFPPNLKVAAIWGGNDKAIYSLQLKTKQTKKMHHRAMVDRMTTAMYLLKTNTN